ncbi:hypothetical protein ACFQZE_23785 [Paenibacillus sp. GCM10027627]|uniref:hypothetical protein n=1 Tax=unclassified Paenibacillus TaxID=185978 RepID=UPI00362D7BB9
MKVGTVEYFKSEILLEDERRYRMAIFIGLTESLVKAKHLTESEKLAGIENLIKAWDEIS